MKKNKILLLFAHPSKHRSEVNAPMFDYAQTLEYVTAVDLYAQYPTYQINIDKEQQRLNSHDVVIFQFPFYWYSTPSILKEWQDLVLEYGYAYGHEGNALNGKLFICAISAGGKEEAYRTKGYNHFSVRELLQPLEQTADITGMLYLPPFALFSSRSALSDGSLAQHIQRWKLLLENLHHDKIDANSVSSLITINELLDLSSSGESQI
ncbi:NAD(P)H-dependent oxidoreductase [Pseudoalteromonas luteoviolacea]|uniref:Flavodoxin-like fold domain-containing protein n=1 Tax=Pseudoalteromonas luteoviolacea DSM 6061 TaxID=1365250 RepID=A0A166V2W1_9GAMM|nr:NAD(P)H-dependent oxidoreductase [Pseudoalteromonas luteoviolacea]KZN31657.1 hypothetical protein N475_04180 [Pseudoalteromonas luteoviolacea DSM 6061]KZN54517.1 hypothetical protein N474_02000 [Pseudoalteromonas luteoviolacea CPMOR-2]TQF70354.1 flavodoxin family protein [Pseudoalteromonas luteoviolacea]